MSFLLYLTFIIFIVVCVFLILLVLIQKGRGGGLASAFGGGGGNTAFGSKTGDVLTWATSIAFGVFLVTAVALNLIADRYNASLQPAVAAPAGAALPVGGGTGGTPPPGTPTAPGQTGGTPAATPAAPGQPTGPTAPSKGGDTSLPQPVPSEPAPKPVAPAPTTQP